MNFNLNIEGASWETVITIPRKTVLEKTMKSIWYKAITREAGRVSARFGCYAWHTTDEILYCGEFAKDYQSKPHNFQARIHNYLTNHTIKKNGSKNTNLMVFEKINETLVDNDITLAVFQFDTLKFGEDVFTYQAYTENSDLVHLVEAFLITHYRQQKQCSWNRT